MPPSADAHDTAYVKHSQASGLKSTSLRWQPMQYLNSASVLCQAFGTLSWAAPEVLLGERWANHTPSTAHSNTAVRTAPLAAHQQLAWFPTVHTTCH